ncbi:MAG: LptF/LptG family permease [Bacteroidales bacterium]|nr:LptF/LptG family permease [Bacteroidales bacterium]
MKRLHKFILKSYFGPLVATFFVSLFILLMQFLWKYIDDLAGKGLEWTIIAELILYASARLVPMALPLAILLSSIMTFGNLGEHFELTAIKSAGVSLQKFMTPLIFLAVLISIGAFYYSIYVIPYTNLKMHSLIYDVRNQRPELQIKEGMFYNGIEGYSIKIAQKNYKTDLLQNIMVYDHLENRNNVKVTVADSGYMRMTADEQNLILTLYNGYSYEEIKESRSKRKKDKNYPHQRQNFDKQVVVFKLTGLDFSRTDEDLFRNHYQMFSLNQLEYAKDSLIIEYNKLINRFSKNILTTNYFKKETSLSNSRKGDGNIIAKNKRDDGFSANKIQPNVNKDTIKTDSIIITPQTFNLDSIFNIQKIKSKSDAINHALTYARTTQNNINNSKKQFKSKAERIRRHQIEWHRKFALSFSCLVFFFIGAPFGAIIRKGGFGTPVVVSVLFFILYYVIMISGEKFAREGILLPYVGMWLPSFILMPLGIFLTYKATTDSGLLNADSYVLFFKKLFNKIFKKSN